MTIYLYRCPDGHEHELDYPMGKAPKIAGRLCNTWTGTFPNELLCCHVLRRVFTVPQIVHGPGFIGPGLAPWSGKVQRSKEAQERFGKGEL